MDGDVAKGWAGPISLAFGGAWREESIDQTIGPDDLIALSTPLNEAANCGQPGAPACTGIRGVPPQFAATPNEVLIFTNVQPISGSYNVSEVFAESIVPLVSGKTAAKDLGLNVAARYADYSGS